MKHIKVVVGVLILTVMVVAVGLSRSPQDAPETVTIGAALSLTGMAAADGESIRKGIEFAQLKLAEEGITLKVIYEDDATEPSQTVSVVSKLVDIDGVTAIIGPTWSFLSAAAANTIQEKQVVSFNPANTSEHVEGQSDYFLFGAPKNSFKAGPTAEWLKRVGATKVAIIVDDGAWGESHLAPFTQAVAEAGATVVLTERTSFGVTGSDIQTIVNKAQALEVDAVLFTGFDQATALIVQKKQSLNADFALLVATEIIRKQDTDGVINVTEADNIHILVPEISVAFEQAFFEQYGEKPGPYTDRAYDGTMMLAKALVEKPEDTTLNEYVRAMNYTGYMGTYSFDENNDLVGGEWFVEQLL